MSHCIDQQIPSSHRQHDSTSSMNTNRENEMKTKKKRKIHTICFFFFFGLSKFCHIHTIQYVQHRPFTITQMYRFGVLLLTFHFILFLMVCSVYTLHSHWLIWPQYFFISLNLTGGRSFFCWCLVPRLSWCELKNCDLSWYIFDFDLL